MAHRLDPRTKIAFPLTAFVLLECFNRATYTGALFAALLLTGIWAGAGSTLRRVAPAIASLVAISVTAWSFHVRGATVIWSWHGLEFSTESLSFGLAMGFRLAGLMIATLVLFATTHLNDFYSGLVLLKVPWRLAFAFALTLGFLPRYVDFAVATLDAQSLRGLDLRSGSPLQRVRKAAMLAIPLFLHIARQTHIRAIALEVRGFSPDRRRSSYRTYVMAGRDWAALAIMTAMASLCGWLHFAGFGQISMR